jgi:hypothetical protein
MQTSSDAYITLDSFVLFSLASYTALYRSVMRNAFVLYVFICIILSLAPRRPSAVDQITYLSSLRFASRMETVKFLFYSVGFL